MSYRHTPVFALLLGSAWFTLHCSSKSEHEGTGGGVGQARVQCGGVECDVTTQKCCYAIGDVGSVKAATCTALADACPIDAPLATTCDDAVDCPAQGLPTSICCATLTCTDPGSESCISGAQCTLPENCVSGDVVVLCNPNLSGSCPNGSKCEPRTGGALRKGFCLPPA